MNLRAQASEHMTPDNTKKLANHEVQKSYSKPITSFAASASPSTGEPCPLCKTEVHPLFSCMKFKSLPHDSMIATVKGNKLCINCLRPGHLSKQCKSLHKCKECQKPHHSLLHADSTVTSTGTSSPQTLVSPVLSNTATGLKSSNLLMTCQYLVSAPSGLLIKARALLDSGSSTSFVSEQLSKSLHLRHSPQFNKITGITGLSHSNTSHFVMSFHVSPLDCPNRQFYVSAIIVPRVTCPLPVPTVSLNLSWDHLTGLQLADPSFGTPGTIDVLLGVDIFVAALLNGRQHGPPGLPTALETVFGWVLAGNAASLSSFNHVSHHATLLSVDDLLRKFWEVEEAPLDPVLSAEEQAAVNHYQANHSRSPEGRFIVLLPKPNVLMFLILVSPGHKQSEDFSLWKDHFVPRVNSTTLLKS